MPLIPLVIMVRSVSERRDTRSIEESRAMPESDDTNAQRVEEALLFADRRLDELHEAIRAVDHRVEVLTRRLALAERELGETVETLRRREEDGPEPAGP
jgi:hypothetical protein